jgi:hypothetical protein
VRVKEGDIKDLEIELGKVRDDWAREKKRGEEYERRNN